MACPSKVSSSVGGGATHGSLPNGLPPVKLDLLTKWEQTQIRKIRKKRRARRRHGLDRKLAHINVNNNDVVQDSESDDDSVANNEDEEEHMPYDSSDERDDFDPDCCCYCAFVEGFDD
ncbi:hypothetical protein PG985_007010 [Apiospora marii]|uniref:uncharacterized protein n=1 Tax=Apiospora marii TaxID=335849 RepID=UPI003130D170